MVRRIVQLIAWVVVMPAMGFGQTTDALGQHTEGWSGTSRFRLSDQAGPSRGFRLFDPTKWSRSQSYSMLLTGGGSAPRAQGLYVHSLQYRLSSNAQMTVHLGYLHQLSSSWNGRAASPPNRLLPGFELTYRPSKRVLIQVNYGTYGAQYRYGSSGLWRDDSFMFPPSPLDSRLRDEER